MLDEPTNHLDMEGKEGADTQQFEAAYCWLADDRSLRAAIVSG
jgi:hypothetical protein